MTIRTASAENGRAVLFIGQAVGREDNLRNLGAIFIVFDSNGLTARDINVPVFNT